MGFIPDIEEICTKLPKQRQTLLFSATMPAPIKKLADKFLNSPKTVEVARPATTNVNIKQYVVPVKSSAADKRETLRELLSAADVTTAIVFCNRKTTVRELNKSLQKSRFKSGEIHGDMEQSQRIAELDRFKDGTINILVASDVAARGLDIKGVSHVFNFDAPWHPDDYVHRVGRTGRAGATGTAYTFVAPDDAENIANIEKLTGQKIERLGSAPAAPVGDDGSEGEKPPRKRTSRSRKPKDAGSAAAPAPVETPAPARPPRAEPRPRREAPKREETPQPRAAHDDAAPDEGWNGPVPDFLSATFGG